MNNKKNNNISTNYKDFKYEYTGYKDFIKQHHLDKNDIKKEKENVIHDHRLQFDFNNPNQHHHDYSFNFNNPNEHYHDYSFNHKKEDHPKYRTESNVNTKKTYQKPQPRNYTQTTIYDSTTNNPKTIYYSKTNSKTNSTPGCIIFIIIFCFFFLPIISFIFETIDNIQIESDYEYDYNYDDNYENNDNDNNNNYNYIEDDLVDYTEPYDKAINSYLNAITHLDYNYVKNSLTDEELRFNDGTNWKNTILTINNLINNNDIYSFNYKYISKILISSYSLEQLNSNFTQIYNSNRKITEAYRIVLKLYINQEHLTQYITVGKIDDTWYLIQSY